MIRTINYNKESIEIITAKEGNNHGINNHVGKCNGFIVDVEKFVLDNGKYMKVNWNNKSKVYEI